FPLGIELLVDDGRLPADGEQLLLQLHQRQLLYGLRRRRRPVLRDQKQQNDGAKTAGDDVQKRHGGAFYVAPSLLDHGQSLDGLRKDPRVCCDSTQYAAAALGSPSKGSNMTLT